MNSKINNACDQICAMILPKFARVRAQFSLFKVRLRSCHRLRSFVALQKRSVEPGTREIDLDRLVWDQDYRQTVKRWLNARADATDQRNAGAPRAHLDRRAA
jgi:hypothetical protein